MSKTTQKRKSSPSPSKTFADQNRETSLNSQNQKKTSLKVSGRGKKSSLSVDLRNRKQEALRRLGIKPEDMVGVPCITPMLKEAEGGLEQVIEALRASDEEDAIAFIRKYDELSTSDRDRVSLEAIAVAAGVRVVTLLGVATKALFQQGETVASILSATARPHVTKKTIQMALQDKGVKDREMFHTATGFLPIPKGTLILNQRTQVANFQSGSSEDDEEDIPQASAFDDLPTMDDDVRGLQATAQKLLDAPKTIEGSLSTPSPK